MVLNRYTGAHHFDIGSYNSYNKKVTGLLSDAFRVIEIYLQNPGFNNYAYFVAAKTDQRNFHELLPKH